MTSRRKPTQEQFWMKGARGGSCPQGAAANTPYIKWSFLTAGGCGVNFQ